VFFYQRQKSLITIKFKIKESVIMSISTLSLSEHFHLSAVWTKEISQPLFDQYKELCFFQYARFSNGKVCGVMTNPLWGDVGIKNKILLEFTPPVPPQPLKKLSFFSLWKNTVPEWIEHELSQCGVYHPISYFDITQQYFDFYTFGIKRSNTIGINTYLNQLEILKKFSFFFREQSKNIFKKMHWFKLKPTKGMELKQAILKNVISQNKWQSDIFDVRRIILTDDLNVNLSKQEYNCLKIISCGKTIKECARMMNLSPKTVENYIYNMKGKLGVHRKSQLIDIYQSIKQ
jgi:DNA-binding CsgD family transcriptional regulator